MGCKRRFLFFSRRVNEACNGEEGGLKCIVSKVQFFLS